MNLPIITQSSFPLTIPSKGAISSDQLNVFSQTVVEDVTQLAAVINAATAVLQTIDDSEKSIIDGYTLPVDSASSATKDHGIFYDSTNNKPRSIYETFVLYAQILANLENGQKEGVVVGSTSVPIVLAASATVSYPWPYTDYAFIHALYKNTAGVVTKLEQDVITVSVTAATHTITITNISGISATLWGYLWHPTFPF